MNSKEKITEEGLYKLISAACDGLLQDDEHNRLERLLQTGEPARQAWLSFSRLHAEIYMQSRSDQLLLKTLQAIQSGALSSADFKSNTYPESRSSAESGVETKTLAAQSASHRAKGNHYRPWAFVIAAGLLAALVLTNIRQNSNDVAQQQAAADPPDQPLVQATPDLRSEAVATIIRKVDCDWESDRWSASTSSDLLPGQSLTLNSGLMQLRFASGAEVTLEAPVSFTVESATHGVLSGGKLSALVPESAKGFTVATPRGDIVDLGTEFGLVVNRNGDAETHVFEGEVIVHPLANATDDKPISLTDDMALRIAGKSASLTKIEAAPERFARIAFDQARRSVAPEIDRDLILWFSAEGAVKVDEQQRVLAWGDELSVSNRAAEDAWQVQPAERPIFVEDAFEGLPGIRFSGNQSLVTSPVSLGPSITAVSVFQVNVELFKKIGPKDESGLQILNTNSYPRLVFGVRDKLGIFSRVRTGARKGPSGEEIPLDASVLLSPQHLLDEKPVVCAVVYDTQRNSSRLYLNGRLIRQAAAPIQEPTRSTRHIGAHYSPIEGKYFFGDLAELMVFNTGLEDEEIHALCQSFMNKYKIAD